MRNFESRGDSSKKSMMTPDSPHVRNIPIMWSEDDAADFNENDMAEKSTTFMHEIGASLNRQICPKVSLKTLKETQTARGHVKYIKIITTPEPDRRTPTDKAMGYSAPSANSKDHTFRKFNENSPDTSKSELGDIFYTATGNNDINNAPSQDQSNQDENFVTASNCENEEKHLVDINLTKDTIVSPSTFAIANKPNLIMSSPPKTISLRGLDQLSEKPPKGKSEDPGKRLLPISHFKNNL